VIRTWIAMPSWGDYARSVIRTQFRLTEAQARRLRVLARRDRASISEVIRRLLARGLDENEAERGQRYARAAKAVGRYRDRKGAKDVARGHDSFLDESFALDRNFEEEGFTLPR
jgi:hypothetical protein